MPIFEKGYSVDETIELMLRGADIEDIVLDDKYEAGIFDLYKDDVLRNERTLKLPVNTDTIEDFHKIKTNTWKIPEKYLQMDMYSFLMEKCTTATQRERVEYEYHLYEKNEAVIILRLMLYLVDTMRDNGVLWGCGRGSAVASYCLFLIGINRIDPIKYDLDIHEMFKIESGSL